MKAIHFCLCFVLTLLGEKAVSLFRLICLDRTLSKVDCKNHAKCQIYGIILIIVQSTVTMA